MFELLFTRPCALARQRNGPLADERRRYLAHCHEQQVARNTLRGIAVYLLIAARTLRLERRPGQTIPPAEIEAAAVRWANRRPRHHSMRSPHRSRALFLNAATRWLAFLGRYQPPAPTPSDHLDRFCDFMLAERGLSRHTIDYRRRMVAAQLYRQVSRRDQPA